MKTFPRFSSFFWAGYECTYALTEAGDRLDMLSVSRHDEYCRIDYNLIKELGITTVREGLSWSEIDKGDGVYDFSRFEKMMETGKEEGIQQIWDLNHFDYPEDISVFTKEFVQRFAHYAQATVTLIRKYQKNILYIVPINEISFFSWIAADQGKWAPYLHGSSNGLKFKQQLVRASIAAMKAICDIDSDVRFIHTDPFMNRVALEPANATAIKHTNQFNNIIRYEAWDMISGKTFPELGGHPKYLDIIGINYYFHNQEFVISEGKRKISHKAMEWESPSRIPFWHMIEFVHERYQRPIVISETGSYEDLRYTWWSRTLSEIKVGLEKGLPIAGVCAYPTVDRPNAINYLLRRSGLWDFEDDDPKLVRIPHQKSIDVIKQFINTTSPDSVSLNLKEHQQL